MRFSRWLSKCLHYKPALLEDRLLKHAERLSKEYTEATSKIQEASDAGSRSELSRRIECIQGLHEVWKQWSQMQSQYSELADWVKTELDAGLKDLARVELEELTGRLRSLEGFIRAELVKPDPEDAGAAILEIRAGTGGDEAAIFSADLYQMYQKYAESKGWDLDELSLSTDGPKAIREVSARISGEGVFGRFKFESGVHRVQRVPTTESQGRIHTSTATVAVLPEPPDVSEAIPDRDIRIDVYRSGGAGGQNAQKTNSAVRAVHIPTGTMVCIQEERSQQTNRMRAIAILQARVYQRKRETLMEARNTQRQHQIGNADRSEKIRTYNFPQGRITDHRISHSLFNLHAFFEGRSLDELIDRLLLKEELERLKDLE